MDLTASQEFVRHILSMPLAWRQRMRHSPPVSQVLFTHGDIETMMPTALALLRTAILETVNNTFTSLLTKFPDGDVLVGTTASVMLKKESLKTLCPGRNLDAEMVRACLACGEWSFRGDVVVVDPVAFKEGKGEAIGKTVDTYEFLPYILILIIGKFVTRNIIWAEITDNL